MPPIETLPADAIVDEVRARYADAARAVLDRAPEPSEAAASCCSPSGNEVFGAIGYDDLDRASLPDAAVLASLGCGNPTAVAELKPGETVLDLGSGGGIDVLLSARRVGPTGFAYGLDMTDEMLELARRNAAEASATNVEFLKGRIESIPLPDASVDVVISNCVINLSTDKAAVLAEIARVLRPGERVLDLGSGGGIDVLLSAKRVGPTGRAFGVDMTDEMLALAQRNAAEAGVTNVEFLKGQIEALPLPADSIDVVISNCVVNLAADKPAVFAEIARVLKPGGRIGITDIVAEDSLSVA